MCNCITPYVETNTAQRKPLKKHHMHYAINIFMTFILGTCVQKSNLVYLYHEPSMMFAMEKWLRNYILGFLCVFLILSRDFNLLVIRHLYQEYFGFLQQEHYSKFVNQSISCNEGTTQNRSAFSIVVDKRLSKFIKQIVPCIFFKIQ